MNLTPPFPRGVVIAVEGGICKSDILGFVVSVARVLTAPVSLAGSGERGLQSGGTDGWLVARAVFTHVHRRVTAGANLA